MDAEDIFVIHATHPDSQEVFRKVATPPDVVKATRKIVQLKCTTCFTTQEGMRTCKRCKGALYCSEACQKKNWPLHKTLCSPSERRTGIQKLVKSIVSNFALCHMLQVCAALDLDLNGDEKKEIGFKHPFVIRVGIAVEPSDIVSFVKLLLTNDPATEKMEGMVQVNSFSSLLPGRSGCPPLTEMMETVWHHERERLNGIQEGNIICLGMVEFANTDSKLPITSLFHVLDGPVKLAKEKEPFRKVSALTGAIIEKPLAVGSQLESLNSHIRCDKNNQLKLRTEMTDTDKAIIRSVRDKSTTGDAVVTLRQKMARELIYANMLQHI